MAKECVVPEPVQIMNKLTGEPMLNASGALDIFDFRKVAYEKWLNDHRWQTPVSRRARLVLILPEFDKRPGQTMRFEDEDHAVLVDIVKNPGKDQQGKPLLYPPLTEAQIDHFNTCVLEAKTYTLDDLGGKSPPKKKP